MITRGDQNLIGKKIYDSINTLSCSFWYNMDTFDLDKLNLAQSGFFENRVNENMESILDVIFYQYEHFSENLGFL